MQFAHSNFGGEDSAKLANIFMVLLKERAKTSLKFRLFLYAIK